MQQRFFWLKLIGTTLLLHVVLIVLSVIEVAVYSFLVNPGQTQEVYEAHAMRSAPWVSHIFGSLFIFLLIRRYILRFSHRHLFYALALPVVYSLIDFLLVFGMADLSSLDGHFYAGKIVKILAGIMAYFIYSGKKTATVSPS